MESLALLWVMKAWLHTFQRATVFVRKRSESELSWGLFVKSLIIERRRGPTEAMGSLFRSKKLTQKQQVLPPELSWSMEILALSPSVHDLRYQKHGKDMCIFQGLAD